VDLLVEPGGFSVRIWEGYIRAGAGQPPDPVGFPSLVGLGTRTSSGGGRIPKPGWRVAASLGPTWCRWWTWWLNRVGFPFESGRVTSALGSVNSPIPVGPDRLAGRGEPGSDLVPGGGPGGRTGGFSVRIWEGYICAGVVKTSPIPVGPDPAAGRGEPGSDSVPAVDWWLNRVGFRSNLGGLHLRWAVNPPDPAGFPSLVGLVTRLPLEGGRSPQTGWRVAASPGPIVPAVTCGRTGWVSVRIWEGYIRAGAGHLPIPAVPFSGRFGTRTSSWRRGSPNPLRAAA